MLLNYNNFVWTLNPATGRFCIDMAVTVAVLTADLPGI